MAKECALCGKKSILVGRYKKLISRYNPTVKKRKYPNLQWTKVPLGIENKKFKKLAGKRLLACTKCIKAFSKIC